MTLKDYKIKLNKALDTLPELYGHDYGNDKDNLLKNNPWALDRRRQVLRKAKCYFTNNVAELTILYKNMTYKLIIE